MIVARLPFRRFFQLVRDIGAKQGFELLISLVAREADCPHVFKELESYWSSIHDITGKQSLFVTLDGRSINKRYDLANVNPFAGSIQGQDGLMVYSKGCHVVTKLADPDLNTQYVEQHGGELVYSEIAKPVPDSRGEGWEDSHSLGINELLRVIDGIDEKDVPCLYIEFLRYSATHYLIPISDLPNRSLYSMLKSLSERTSPKFVELSSLRIRLKENIGVASRAERESDLVHSNISDTYKSIEKELHDLSFRRTQNVENDLMSRAMQFKTDAELNLQIGTYSEIVNLLNASIDLGNFEDEKTRKSKHNFHAIVDGTGNYLPKARQGVLAVLMYLESRKLELQMYVDAIENGTPGKAKEIEKLFSRRSIEKHLMTGQDELKNLPIWPIIARALRLGAHSRKLKNILSKVELSTQRMLKTIAKFIESNEISGREAEKITDAVVNGMINEKELEEKIRSFINLRVER